MTEANPESLLIYRELWEHITKALAKTNKKAAYFIKKVDCDGASKTELIRDCRRLGIRWYMINEYRWLGLRDIREHLVKVGILERRNAKIKMSEKTRVTRRYTLNRSEFYEP